MEEEKKNYSPLTSSGSLPDPELELYYRDEENRVIWIDSDVNENTLNIVRLILRYNREDEGIPVEERKPIRLLIFSYGGDGMVCYGLVDVITMSKTPVYTVNMGVAMSAGLLILLAGHKRFCLPRSTALIHSGSGSVNGTFEQTEAQMKDYKHFVEIMRDFVSERSSIPPQKYLKNKDKEWYLYAKEMVEYHVVDEVINDLDMIL